MTSALIIFVIAFSVNLFLEVFRRKLLPDEKLEEIKKKSEEINKKLKNMKKEDMQKVLEENLDFYLEVWHTNLKYILMNSLIIILVLVCVVNVFKGEIVIPLPFKVPITGNYGLGPLGSYIVFSLLSSVVIKSFYYFKRKYKK